MKKIVTAMALTGLMMLSSCGDKMSATESIFSDNAVAPKSDSANYDTKGYGGEYAASEESYDSEAANGENSASGGIEQIDYKQSDVKAINTQMLVYSCDMSIDVLEFEDSVDQFHDLITKYKGFIESENYSDGGNSTQWKYTEEKKWKTLNALIRIPSADYDNFCRDAEAIGDMRRKNASVQNLTTEYSDLKTTLKIYEAKEQRYLDLLENTKDEKQAVAIEEELTSIQIEIARIKTRMNNIEGDVAYSYINLTLNEVREYTEEPVEIKTDTFGQRLKNTVSRTWDKFLEFLEGLLFFIIRVFPYAVLFGIAAFIISKLKKLYAKKHPDREPKHKKRNALTTVTPAPVNNETPKPEDDSEPIMKDHSDIESKTNKDK